MTKTIANLIRSAALAAVTLITLTLPGLAQYASPMHDVAVEARQPVQFKLELDGTDGSPSLGANAYQVPAGKRLVIEQVTGRVGIPSPQIIEASIVLTAGGLSNAQHFLRFDPPLPLNGDSEYYTTLPVRFYADPGTFVGLRVARYPTTGNWAVLITVSGYLVNLP